MQGRFKMECRLFTIVRYNYKDYNITVVPWLVYAKYAQYEPAKIGNNDIGLLGSCKLEK